MDALLDTMPAPDFQSQTSAGEAFQLAQYQGQRHVVLVFNRGFT
jgi:peroxiredoxin